MNFSEKFIRLSVIIAIVIHFVIFTEGNDKSDKFHAYRYSLVQ